MEFTQVQKGWIKLMNEKYNMDTSTALSYLRMVESQDEMDIVNSTLR